MRQRRDIKRRTSRGVYLWDRAASAVISVGGVVVLAAVLGICVFLVWEAMPLFRGGRAQAQAGRVVAPAVQSRPLVTVLGDESEAAVFLEESGQLRAVALRTGQEFWRSNLGGKVTAVSRPEHEGLLAVGLEDGSVRIGRLAISGRLLRDDELTPEMKALAVGGELAVGEGEQGRLIERARSDQFRETTPKVELTQSQGPGAAAVTRIDLRESPAGGRFVVAVRSDGSASFGTVRTITPLGGGAPRSKVTSTPFALARPGQTPDWAFSTGDGKNVLMAWRDGTLERYATGLGSESGVAPVLEERIGGTAGTAVRTAGMLLGGETLLVGDSKGVVHSFEVGRDVTSPASDAMRLVDSGSFRVGEKPIAEMTFGERERVVAAADEGGAVVVRHMTSGKVIARVRSEDVGEGAASMALSPKGDGLLAMDGSGRYQLWTLSIGHADASFASLFSPLVYEGEVKPRFIYQSSSGSDASQVKLSLVPLIFGTLKATVVGMVVAVPLAVLGAIYSSEFMHKRVRRVVKPAVEMMASLPSVVLGFIAAMVVAPFMRNWLSQILVGILLTPVFLVFFAYLWQLAPRTIAAAVTRRARVLLVGLALLVSALLAGGLGPVVERALFRPTHNDVLVAAGSYKAVAAEEAPAWVGRRQTMSPEVERRLRREGMYYRDGQVVRPVEARVDAAAAGPASIQRWLDGSIGDALPGWLAALFAPVMLGLAFAQARLIDRERFEQVLGTGRLALAIAELARFVLVVVVGAAVTLVLAWALTRMGLDTRDWIFGSYSQRNSLVVGVIMGFAVIPLVYTISEDALRSVPNSLRSASLGVGATPWQTAVRVVLPAAGSGVFSAIMIGLGRAVGETMIVLMAAGNTPEISSNLFSGFRTLAANIAVELPEAVHGSTHYRVLFLCGLVLFAMTFAVNTTAEVVRQRFRKRNAAL